MGNKISCFVIIGYGKKTSYANGKLRVLDLDETYNLLIKPVFDALDIDCYRAIDKNLNGSIDKVMLQEIKNAAISLVDLSTLNANVMWELGVRHSLKPNHTIMICEKEQMSSMPFDINHFVIHQYAHAEEGIPYKEVERFRNQLTTIVKGLLAQASPASDSPVFTFLESELNTGSTTTDEADADSESNTSDSFATIMAKAEEAKAKKEYEKALGLLATAKKFALGNMTLKDNLSFIICRQALCTYKWKQPSELESYIKAKLLLEELKPEQSQDIEVLGLSGAIEKRLNELTSDSRYLDQAIKFYERAFQLKGDYYNGINAAFMTYKQASQWKTAQKVEWEDTKTKADYIRNAVINTCIKMESDPKFLESKDAVWVLLTLAEAYHYKGNEAKQKEYEEKATLVAKATNDDFALDSYQEQKEKIVKIMQQLNG